MVGFAPLKPAEFVIVQIKQKLARPRLTARQTTEDEPCQHRCFPVNAHRYDPYRTFKFQVVIAGRTVAGL